MVFKQGRWFAQFLCEVQLQHDPRRARNRSDAVARRPDTGLDTGLTNVASLADGKKFAPAKPLKKAVPLLRREQRKMSRQFEARKPRVRKLPRQSRTRSSWTKRARFT